MSFDEIVSELPKLTGPEFQQIAEKAEFLAGLDEGLRQITEGKLIAHEEVKAQVKSWLIGSSGRPKPFRIYATFVRAPGYIGLPSLLVVQRLSNLLFPRRRHGGYANAQPVHQRPKLIPRHQGGLKFRDVS